LIRSMTGYGYGEATSEEYKICVEIKTVNHRFCEIFLKLPCSFGSAEEKIKKKIRSCVVRGRVDVHIKVENMAERRYSVKVDKSLALAYHKAMKGLKEDLQIEGEIEVKDLINLPGVVEVQEVESDIARIQPAVERAIELALDELVEMREKEGKNLAGDVMLRAKKVEEFLQEIEKRAPVVLDDYRSRLRQRLKEWIDAGAIDEERISAEAALFAERSDITEEIVRLRSHLRQMDKFLTTGGAVGRKLDFLIQEMHREINTIGAKASDAEISALVV